MNPPLPHEPVSYRWFCSGVAGNVFPWRRTTWTSRIVLGPLDPTESVQVRLGSPDGQLVTVRHRQGIGG